MISTAMRYFRDVQKTTYVKVPIIHSKKAPPAPLIQDYEMLQVSPSANNRELIQAFRQLTFHIHPANDTSINASSKYMQYVEAYDRIVLYRMAEDGIPQPYTEAFYPPQRHTKVIKEFLEENDFWLPHVKENYTQLLFAFWAIFGVFHTLFQIYNPFLIQ